MSITIDANVRRRASPVLVMIAELAWHLCVSTVKIRTGARQIG
jgi:hypothetical protein